MLILWMLIEHTKKDALVRRNKYGRIKIYGN